MAVEQNKGQVVCSSFRSKKVGSAASSAVQFQSKFLSFLGEAATGTSKYFILSIHDSASAPLELSGCTFTESGLKNEGFWK